MKALLFFAFAVFLTAAHAAPLVQDHDLSGGAPAIFSEIPVILAPDRVATVDGPFSVQILREDHGKLTAVEGLPIRSTRCTGTRGRIEAELARTGRFSVTNGTSTYRITAEVPCQGATELVFNQDSNGGQALGIWQVAFRAESRLAESVDLRFWDTPITFVWPDRDGADYYNFGQVHISRGDHWDVVGHEMGHAIYDLAGLGTFGGGPHKIDECYSKALALSEGWASFFAGWVSLGLDDEDARFEYMVPRRAPIRFENIPDDVCLGEKNEWRVTGFFWDLLDLHDDDEKSTEPFATMWNALARSGVGSTSEARARLEGAGIDRTLLQILWKLNFGK